MWYIFPFQSPLFWYLKSKHFSTYNLHSVVHILLANTMAEYTYGTCVLWQNNYSGCMSIHLCPILDKQLHNCNIIIIV